METKTYDFISIGAGAAGLTAAQYAARSNLKTVVLDQAGSGGQALTISHLENYPGVFPALSGPDFTEKLEQQAKSFGAEVVMTQVTGVDKIGSMFTVQTRSVRYEAPAVLIATGAEHRKLDIPGEKQFEGRGVSYCATCDGPFFRNKKIAVVGGGDSACDEATYLATLSPTVTLIHRKSQLRAQKAVADRVLKNPNITVRLNCTPVEIKGDSKVQSLVLKNTETGALEEAAFDAVFIFVGMTPRTSLVEMLKTDEGGYIVTNDNMETSVPGMYAAGDVRAKPFRQVVTAAADGAIAAHQAEQFIRTQRNEVYR